MTGTKKPAAPPTPSFVCSCGGCLPADGVISRPRATCSTHHYPVGVLLAVCEPRRPGLDLVVSDNAVCAESSGTKLGVGGAHSCVSGASRASAPQVRPWTCGQMSLVDARDAPEGRSRGSMPEEQQHGTTIHVGMHGEVQRQHGESIILCCCIL